MTKKNRSKTKTKTGGCDITARGYQVNDDKPVVSNNLSTEKKGTPLLEKGGRRYPKDSVQPSTMLHQPTVLVLSAIVLAIGCMYLSTNSIVTIVEQFSRQSHRLFGTSVKTTTNNNAVDKTVDNVAYNPMNNCGIVMANSSLSPDSGFGIFVLSSIKKGQEISHSDLVIQIPDLTSLDGIGYLLETYVWKAHVTGGLYEGKVVYSFVPGVGSLANGHFTLWNMVPSRTSTTVDEGHAVRGLSPGAGAFTHYHNFTFHAYKDLSAGSEVLANYGFGWENKIPRTEERVKTTQAPSRPVGWLRTHGWCLDHIQPAPLSRIPHAGRGAVASRWLPRGTVVAPMPLIPITTREAMRMTNKKLQLLLNYCWGHDKSSILFLPYGASVNLINHDPNPNVEIRWSSHSILHYESTFDDLMNARTSSGILLEVVALRDIDEGEEIFIDYGPLWQQAWEEHLKNHVPKNYSPAEHQYASQVDADFKLLKTVQELKEEQYPANVQTRCLYKYNGEADRRGSIQAPIQWKATPGIDDMFPCHVLDRSEDSSTYTVLVEKSDSLLLQDSIPPNHVVTGVPRTAIRLENRMRASDQHLPTAFRHELHLAENVFPPLWRDLA